jgi:hypothetical protein
MSEQTINISISKQGKGYSLLKNGERSGTGIFIPQGAMVCDLMIQELLGQILDFNNSPAIKLEVTFKHQYNEITDSER